MTDKKARDKEALLFEQSVVEALVTLVRAHNDARRPAIREKGIGERDLAFEAGMLEPPDMEMTMYATQRRSRVLRVMREMQTRGWCHMDVLPPIGAYFIKLTPEGEQAVAQSADPSKSWLQRLFGGK